MRERALPSPGRRRRRPPWRGGRGARGSRSRRSTDGAAAARGCPGSGGAPGSSTRGPRRRGDGVEEPPDRLGHVGAVGGVLDGRPHAGRRVGAPSTSSGEAGGELPPHRRDGAERAERVGDVVLGAVEPALPAHGLDGGIGLMRARARSRRPRRGRARRAGCGARPPRPGTATSRSGSPARPATRAASSCSTFTRPGLTFTRTGKPATSTTSVAALGRPPLERRRPARRGCRSPAVRTVGHLGGQGRVGQGARPCGPGGPSS